MVAGLVVELGRREGSPEDADMDRLRWSAPRVARPFRIRQAVGCFSTKEPLAMCGYDRAEDWVGDTWRVVYGPERMRRTETEGIGGRRLRATRRSGRVLHEALTLSLRPSGGRLQLSGRVRSGGAGREAEGQRGNGFEQPAGGRTMRTLSGGDDFSVERMQSGVGGTARLTLAVQVVSGPSQEGSTAAGRTKVRSSASPAEAVGPDDRRRNIWTVDQPTVSDEVP
jgi:hypothetical protein